MSLGRNSVDVGATRTNRLSLLPLRSRFRRGRGDSEDKQRRGQWIHDSQQQVAPEKAKQAPIGQPIVVPADPRWVLALRTAEQLEGTILTLDRREKLVRLGQLMHLTPFDTNLVIAIVQDQARRGILPQDCPSASELQLAMVPLPQLTRGPSRWNRMAWVTAILVATMVTMEIVVILMFLRN